MRQMGMFDSGSRWTVTDLTRYIRQLLELDETLRELWVQGEISNFSRPASGHLYFTLKDSGAQIRAVMWRNEAARVQFPLVDGLAVEVHGSLSVYEAGGQYQLYADIIRPLGEGAMYQEFLRLKALLEAEGLFDPGRKRSIPEMPGRIGIVTSPTGAALQDMLNTLRRRNPLAEVLLAPTPVQGDDAPLAIVRAIEMLNRIAIPDVILLARGGGSIEDLWAFNDERVVRAVAASVIPIVTGVGHETDFTLADFAADLRAPTPTAAAELATPVTVGDRSNAIQSHLERIGRLVFDRLSAESALVDDLQTLMRLYSPSRRLQTERQRLDELTRRGGTVQAHRLGMQRTRVAGLGARLGTLNPLATLERGYALVTRKSDGRIVSRAASVSAGEALGVRVADGSFDVQVNEGE
ncbi:MAG: exodeoxyribonuclease VII large subunit [Chloroflexota bacterium]